MTHTRVLFFNSLPRTPYLQILFNDNSNVVTYLRTVYFLTRPSVDYGITSLRSTHMLILLTD